MEMGKREKTTPTTTTSMPTTTKTTTTTKWNNDGVEKGRKEIKGKMNLNGKMI